MYGHYEIVANRSLDGGNTWQRYVVGGYEAAQLTYDPEMNPSVSVHGGNNRMFVVWTDSRLNGQQVEENDLYCARVDWPGQGSGSGGTMAGGSRTISGGSVSVSPNPVRDEGLVRFHVARTTSADVSVFDKSGGLVAHLAGGRLAPGWHAVRWDATDTRGVRVAPGVYFVRLAAGTDRAAVKVVVAR
jgi:hypothetical protein